VRKGGRKEGEEMMKGRKGAGGRNSRTKVKEEREV
jgi:hypothetical protein